MSARQPESLPHTDTANKLRELSQLSEELRQFEKDLGITWMPKDTPSMSTRLKQIIDKVEEKALEQGMLEIEPGFASMFLDAVVQGLTGIPFNQLAREEQRRVIQELLRYDIDPRQDPREPL